MYLKGFIESSAKARQSMAQPIAHVKALLKARVKSYWKACFDEKKLISELSGFSRLEAYDLAYETAVL